MKTPTALKSITLIALLGAALAAPAGAQGGPGMGRGWGGGPGLWHGGGGGMGPGPGMRHGGRGMMMNDNGGRGWMLTTPEERTAFQIKMREVRTYDDCKVLQADHLKALESRARDKGVTWPGPRRNGCDMLKARGLIK